MLKLLQHIRPSALAYLLLFTILIHLPSFFINPVTGEIPERVFMFSMFSGVQSVPSLSLGLAVILVFIQALMFNRLCIHHDVLYVHTYMPAWFFIIANSLFPANLYFSPVLVSNFFVIGALSLLFQLHNSQSTGTLLFYAAAFFSISSLFVTEYLGAPVFLVMAAIIFKNISARDFISIVTGAIFPFGVIMGITYVAGADFTFPIPRYAISFDFSASILSIMPFILLLLISFAGVIKNLSNYNKNNIKTRRISLLLILLFAVQLVFLLIRYDNLQSLSPVAASGMAVFGGYFLIGNKTRRIKELLHLVLIVAVILSLYSQLLPH
jgi:hypothetical protein